MPEDVRNMLGLPIDPAKKRKIRSKSESRPGDQNLFPSVKKSPDIRKAKSKDQIIPPSLQEKFDQQEKRTRIKEFLDTCKEGASSQKSPALKAKNKAVIDALTEKIPPAQPPADAALDSPGPKLKLADVIIAAAAAKTVKLKSEGKNPNISCPII